MLINMVIQKSVPCGTNRVIVHIVNMVDLIDNMSKEFNSLVKSRYRVNDVEHQKGSIFNSAGILHSYPGN